MQAELTTLQPEQPLFLDAAILARIQKDYLEKAKPEACFEEIRPHYKPGWHFARFNVQAKDRFFPVLIPLEDGHKFKLLTKDEGQKLREAVLNFQKSHLGDSLIGGFHCTLGTDPEVFVLDGNGELLPAFEFLPDKTKVGQGQAFWDGFQAEFTVKPAGCLAYHVDDIRAGLKSLLTAAHKHDKKAKLSIASVTEVPQKILQTGKTEHVILGCDPSKNIYGNSGMNPGDGRDLPVRFAGGHIHLGLDYKSIPNFVEKAVKSMDALLGVACVSLFAAMDSPLRRQYYGLAGEYREPSHGLEYRTLSNGWLCDPAITHFTFDLARESARFGVKNLLRYVDGADPKRVQDIINGCDVKEARKYIEANKAVYTSILKHIYNGLHTTIRYSTDDTNCASEEGFNLLLNGVEYAVKDPSDIAGNWLLNGRQSWAAHSENAGVQWYKKAKELRKAKKPQ
jgi:hypothetical protein